MKDFIKDKVADYKVPDRIVFLDRIPMTDSGKIKKDSLVKDIERANRSNTSVV